jgi:hypothetical protein
MSRFLFGMMRGFFFIGAARGIGIGSGGTIAIFYGKGSSSSSDSSEDISLEIIPSDSSLVTYLTPLSSISSSIFYSGTLPGTAKSIGELSRSILSAIALGPRSS